MNGDVRLPAIGVPEHHVRAGLSPDYEASALRLGQRFTRLVGHRQAVRVWKRRFAGARDRFTVGRLFGDPQSNQIKRRRPRAIDAQPVGGQTQAGKMGVVMIRRKILVGNFFQKKAEVHGSHAGPMNHMGQSVESAANESYSVKRFGAVSCKIDIQFAAWFGMDSECGNHEPLTFRQHDEPFSVGGIVVRGFFQLLPGPGGRFVSQIINNFFERVAIPAIVAGRTAVRLDPKNRGRV